MTLNELYKKRLLEYKETGKREKPDRLLAMLITPEKDNYEPLMVCEGEFYKAYKSEIDAKIAQVMEDFELTDEDIKEYIEEKGVSSDNFEHDKIWFVFCEGFGAMHWALMYHPDKTPEEIYADIFDSNDLNNEDSQEIKLTKDRKNNN